MVLEGFTELGFPIADENVGLMLDVAVFLFRPSQTAAEAEAERVANEEKAMQKVLSTSNDKEMVRRSLGPDFAHFWRHFCSVVRLLARLASCPRVWLVAIRLG